MKYFVWVSNSENTEVQDYKKDTWKHHQFFCSFLKKLGEQASKPQDLKLFYSSEGWEFPVVLTCPRPATDMTNRMGCHNTIFPLPSSLQTIWEQGNSSLPTWNSSCSLKWMWDEFTLSFLHGSLAKHVIKTLHDLLHDRHVSEGEEDRKPLKQPPNQS